MEYVIYTNRIAKQLREKGFKIVRTGINERHPQFDTYIFEDSEEFQQALTEITRKSKEV